MASRVDAIQKNVIAALKKEAADYVKRNPHPKAGHKNEAPSEFLLKAARDLVDRSGIRDALVEDALASIGSE